MLRFSRAKNQKRRYPYFLWVVCDLYVVIMTFDALNFKQIFSLTIRQAIETDNR